MKIRTITLTMMTLMLSISPLMAMDSEYLQKRQKALHAGSESSAMQAEPSIDRHRDRDANRRADRQHRRVDDQGELTREALRYWWN